ncbi:MAG: four helix bundle protein [Parabacteroides sp.]
MDKVKLVSNTHIYLDTNALLDEILDITPNFPRAYKYSIGAKMHELGIGLLQDIAAAFINRERESRIQYLVNFQTKFEILKTLMRKAGERKWIKGIGRYAHIIELMDVIGKQSTAWKNSLIKVKE